MLQDVETFFKVGLSDASRFWGIFEVNLFSNNRVDYLEIFVSKLPNNKEMFWCYKILRDFSCWPDITRFWEIFEVDLLSNDLVDYQETFVSTNFVNGVNLFSYSLGVVLVDLWHSDLCLLSSGFVQLWKTCNSHGIWKKKVSRHGELFRKL